MTVRIIFMPLLFGALGNSFIVIGRFTSDKFFVRVIT
ncbi:hypothetical protein LINPERHAP1_LOCUS15472 [Linum perenne]